MKLDVPHGLPRLPPAPELRRTQDTANPSHEKHIYLYVLWRNSTHSFTLPHFTPAETMAATYLIWSLSLMILFRVVLPRPEMSLGP